jgi:hypothetical protein
VINEDVVELSTSHSRVGTGRVDLARHRWCGRPKSARRMTVRTIDWVLCSTERELLRRDCEASGVPVAVEDQWIESLRRVL